MIIRSTVLVLMVKALASPHSPPPAYLAVAFQGLAGALLFSVLKSPRIACILLGILSMTESAAQKLILLTLVFGKNFWFAVNELFKQVMKEFHLHTASSYTFWVIGIYLLFYALWGVAVGWWASGIPKRIAVNKEKTLTAYRDLHLYREMFSAQKKKHTRFLKLFLFVFISVFITAVFIFIGAGTMTILKMLLRSFAAILLLFFVVQPIVKYLFSRWLNRQTDERKRSAKQLLEMLPQLRNYVSPAFDIAGKEARGIRKAGKFVVNLLILGLYAE